MWIVGKRQLSGHIHIKLLFASEAEPRRGQNSSAKDTRQQQQQLADAVYKW